MISSAEETIAPPEDAVAPTEEVTASAEEVTSFVEAGAEGGGDSYTVGNKKSSAEPVRR
jgi:hypothetical protein